jgi:trk system potassium uptake protein TrkA
MQRCIELNELLPSATIIHGDGSDQDLLLDEGLNNYSAVVPLTNSDEENIIISIFAAKQHVKKLITKINKQSFVGLIETIGMSSVVSPKELTAQKIVSYIRAKSNSRGSNIRTLYKVVNNQIEALEFIAKKNSKVANKPLKDLKLKKNILIAAIIKENEVIIPKGIDMIQENDSVIVITKDHMLDELSDILV